MFFFFFFQAEDGIRDLYVTGVQTCALPISAAGGLPQRARAAVRVLHARNDHGGRRPAAREPGPQRPGDPRGPGGQPLPVHRLREHRPRGTPRGRVRGDVMTATQEPATEFGRARPRKEDARLVTGQTTWTDNITLPGMLHLAILRSPMAHARITHIDVSPARQRPGVIAAFSGQDFKDVQ